MTKYALSIAIGCLMAAMPLAGHAKSLVDRHIDSLVNTTRVLSLEGEGPRMVRFTSEPDLPPEQDSIRRLVLAFYYDQFRHSQDPEAPTFLFMSKSANMLLGIGGVVRMRGWYDWGGAMNMDGTHRYARRAGLMCQFSF